MNLETIEELEGKFKYLEKRKGDPQKLESLSDDYIKYLGESKSLGQVVRRLALDDKIPIPVVKSLFRSFVVPQMLNPLKEVSCPPFWDNIIEEKFRLQTDFHDFLNELNNRISRQTTHRKINKKITNKGAQDESKWAAEVYSYIDFKIIEDLHQNLLKSISAKKDVLEIKHVEFKEKESVLKINKQIEISILSLRKGTSLCRVMFNKAKKGEPVEWSVIYEEITGLEMNFSSNKNPPEQRVVRDAMYSINNRIKEVTGSEIGIFCWEEKSVIRLY